MFILFLILFGVVNAQLECSQNNIPVFTINDYSLFQSPNFPQGFIGDTVLSSCGIQINAENPNFNLRVLMINGAASRVEFFNSSDILSKYSISNYSSNFLAKDFSFPFNSVIIKIYHNSTIHNWTAYQAAAVAYDPLMVNCSCLLSTKVFDFYSNSDLIIPILATANTNKNCNWIFNIGSLQQLKIVIREIAVFPYSSIVLYDNENLIYNFTNQIHDNDDPLILYFNGTSFNLTFATTNDALNAHSYFYFFVSAVKILTTYTSDGCLMPQINGSTTTYTNIDYYNGYPANQRCDNIIMFPPNYEAMIGVYEYNYEACCDIVSLTNDNNQSLTLKAIYDDDYNDYVPDFKYLTSKFNGSVLSFISDGSIQEAGYKIILTAYECVCEKQSYVIECNETVRVTPLNNNEHFCDKMDCIYQITSNCPGSYFRLDPWFFGLRDDIDSALLKNNGNLVENFTSDTDDEGYQNFLKDYVFTLEFHSGISKDFVDTYKLWYIDIVPVYPTFVKIMLDETSPSHVLWLGDMDNNCAYTVCAAKGQLEIFITLKAFFIWEFNNLELFDDSDLRNYVGNFHDALTSVSSALPKSRKSTSGCFTIYSHYPHPYDEFAETNHTILFKVEEGKFNSKKLLIKK
uniref:CUB domain-containing protein n=1 Tax=Panagrolaimus sp. PS1159 TaxID=55785 RepID=A0AC35FG14_9BILA